jgi:hypothetical protein
MNFATCYKQHITSETYSICSVDFHIVALGLRAHVQSIDA